MAMVNGIYCGALTVNLDITMDKIVTIYSTPTCHFCHAAKEFFTENNIAFTDVDVAADAEKRQEMIDKTKQLGVPVIIIDEDVIIGFDQKAIDKAIG